MSVFLIEPPGASNLSDTCDRLVSVLFEENENGILRVFLVLEFAIETEAFLLLIFFGNYHLFFFSVFGQHVSFCIHAMAILLFNS